MAPLLQISASKIRPEVFFWVHSIGRLHSRLANDMVIGCMTLMPGGRWLLESEKKRDLQQNLTMAGAGLKQGINLVPEEWRSELTLQIDQAVRILELEKRGSSRLELVGAA